MILFAIGISSIKILYKLDEIYKPILTIKLKFMAQPLDLSNNKICFVPNYSRITILAKLSM